jgi:hypothetical protein
VAAEFVAAEFVAAEFVAVAFVDVAFVAGLFLSNERKSAAKRCATVVMPDSFPAMGRSFVMTLGDAHAGGACDRRPSQLAWKRPFNRLELLKRLRLTTVSAVL